MLELSHSQFPPGGWQFHQAQTGWSAPTPLSTTFDSTVQLIINMRRKNPAICVKHNLSLDTAKVAAELETFTRLRLGIPLPAPKMQSALLPNLDAGIVRSVSEIKKLAFGSGLLMDWAESGKGPVAGEEAERRAVVCSSCPLNDVGKLEGWLQMPIASMLKTRIARLNALNLSTAQDRKLGLCSAMFCPGNYLVHEPSELIAKRLGNGKHDPIWEKCWLR